MRTYDIDDEVAFNDFMSFLKEEKPEKTISGNIITLPEFKVKIFPEYETRMKELFEEEYTGFNVDDYDTEIVENHGYKFITFKE